MKTLGCVDNSQAKLGVFVAKAITERTVMTDGIDSYKGFEMDWAIGTIIENAESAGLSNFASVEEMVEATYEFISKSFEEESLSPPSISELIEQVSAKLEDSDT